jgi:hypothetical protein
MLIPQREWQVVGLQPRSCTWCVVACPHSERNFDGKILKKRVSKTQSSKKPVYYKLIIDNYEINNTIHKEWRKVNDLNDVLTNMTVGGILDSLQDVESSEINQQTKDHLVI